MSVAGQIFEVTALAYLVAIACALAPAVRDELAAALRGEAPRTLRDERREQALRPPRAP